MILVLLLTALFAIKSNACCSLAPAKFSTTRGLVGQSKKGGKLIHILAYQNTVANLSTNGGNAMFLPIPAKLGTMTEKNIIDPAGCPGFLRDIEDALFPKRISYSYSISNSRKEASPVLVFESGIYTVVLAQNARAIPAALERVPKDKRPSINNGIFDAYAKWYPGWTFALCCFNNKEAKTAPPMVWWYEPLNPAELFFPGLDAHSGAIPEMNTSVDVDHMLAVGGDYKGSKSVRYFGSLGDELRQLLPTNVAGNKFDGWITQGDFVWQTSDLENGDVRPLRVLPPGASSNHVLGTVESLLRSRNYDRIPDLRENDFRKIAP